MAHIPRDEIQEMWNNAHEKSWSGLEHSLESHSDKSYDPREVRMIVHMSEDMENSGQPFPKNVDELYNIINENFGAEKFEE